MMAESLPFPGSTGPLSGLELDAWYEDLQDSLFSEAKNAVLLQKETEQEVPVEDLDSSSCYLWTLESVNTSLPVSFTEEEVVALEAVVEQLPSEVLEFLNQDSQNDFDPQPVPSEASTIQSERTAEVESSCSSPSSHTATEDEESSSSQSGVKRKRSCQPPGRKVRAKEKEQENEKQAAYLMTENERLKGEIERLTIEVEQTRKALIERMVNLKKV